MTFRFARCGVRSPLREWTSTVPDGLTFAPHAMRLRSLVAGFIVIGAGCGSPPEAGVAGSTPAPPGVPRAELSLARDPAVVLDSADALIARDSSVGLVTV